MSFNKKKILKMAEGAETSFDILGRGFRRNYREDSVSVSWLNVGTFFNKGFADFGQKMDKIDIDYTSRYQLQD